MIVNHGRIEFEPPDGWDGGDDVCPRFRNAFKSRRLRTVMLAERSGAPCNCESCKDTVDAGSTLPPLSDTESLPDTDDSESDVDNASHQCLLASNTSADDEHDPEDDGADRLSRKQRKALDREIPWRQLLKLPADDLNKYVEATKKEAKNFDGVQSVLAPTRRPREFFRTPVGVNAS